jgi:gelsolin
MEPSEHDLEKIKKSEYAQKFFAEAGRKEKVEVYRIEKFDPVEMAKDTHGKFYTGDSYMIVVNNERLYDLHFWHGDFATGDEVSSSAIWTVQLAGHLDMDSRQHLEL